MPRFGPNATFNPRDLAAEGPDDRPGAYYVSVVDGRRYALALGPFDTHADALERVEDVRRYCNDHSPRAWFYGFGTCRLEPDDEHPSGQLNAALGAGEEEA